MTETVRKCHKLAVGLHSTAGGSGAECKHITLVRVLDEACRSLPDFYVQMVEEPEQRLVRLKDYAQQSRNEIEKLKAEHEA